MKYDTINEAAHAFVNEMDAIPREMIAKLMEYDPDDWQNVTPPSVGDRVYVYDECESGEITHSDGEGFYTVELDNGQTIECGTDDFENESAFDLPMWGTMWSFSDSSDDYWLTEDGGLQKMADCGFTIFESEEFGYFFGIDGAGYDFYEAHWIPLYKARGLHWHKEDECDAA